MRGALGQAPSSASTVQIEQKTSQPNSKLQAAPRPARAFRLDASAALREEDGHLLAALDQETALVARAAADAAGQAGEALRRQRGEEVRPRRKEAHRRQVRVQRHPEIRRRDAVRPRRSSARQGEHQDGSHHERAFTVLAQPCATPAAELRGARPPRSALPVVSRPLRRRWTPRRCASSARAASPAITDKFVMAPVKTEKKKKNGARAFDSSSPIHRISAFKGSIHRRSIFLL